MNFQKKTKKPTRKQLEAYHRGLLVILQRINDTRMYLHDKSKEILENESLEEDVKRSQLKYLHETMNLLNFLVEEPKKEDPKKKIITGESAAIKSKLTLLE